MDITDLKEVRNFIEDLWTKLELNRIHNQGNRLVEKEYIKLAIQYGMNNGYWINRELDHLEEAKEDKEYTLALNKIEEASLEFDKMYYKKLTPDDDWPFDGTAS